MSFLTSLYNKSIEENEKNLRFWEDYLQSLKSLDFNVYSDKFRVPVLVPIGSRICFRGVIKHTNEVTVSLGAHYFAKCSLKQAEVLRQHRLKNAQEKINMYRKEKEYLENQISFSNLNLFEQEGQEIVEVYSEEEDKAWREKHKDNMRKYKQANKKEKQKEDANDEELLQRLEELELQEELENELQEMNNNEDLDSSGSNESFIIKDDEEIIARQTEEDNKLLSSIDSHSTDLLNKNMVYKQTFTVGVPHQTSKLDLLQQVIDRQNDLGNRLLELKNRERCLTKTESDLISRLDEIEQLEEIEDEMDRLDDVLEGEDIQETGVTLKTTVKRQVTFADDDNSVTLELTFQHSDMEPDKSPYDSAKGIQKPSDIFEAYPNSFGGSTSILKKSKYEIDKISQVKKNTINKLTKPEDRNQNYNSEDSENQDSDETVVIKDVIERENPLENKLENEARPTSLFKKKRMQKNVNQ